MLPDINTLTYVNKVQEYKPGMSYMIEAFATWCPPCRGMIPHLAKIPTKYPNVYLVSVSEEDVATVEGFASRISHMKEYNVACDTNKEVRSLMEKNNCKGIPAAFLFNKNGEMVWSGHPASGECEEHLSKLNSL